jgi:UDP-N-acetyl-2-amino-2-deoxyglucuronate dehydrogenase
MDKIHLAVIGVGNMGKIHADNLFNGRVKKADLAAVADCSQEALKWCKEHLPGIPAYSDYHKMLDKEKIDGVIVVTPHYSHPEIAIAALNHNCHVLIEKPLAVTTKRAKEIIKAAEEHPSLVCGVAFNQRSNPVYKSAKKLIQEGRLGIIRSARYEISDWYRPASYYKMNPWRGSYEKEGGGCLINQCHHQLDLIQWILGLPSTIQARCTTVDRKISGENDVLAILTYPTFKFVFTASCHDLKGINIMDISGDKGRLVITKTRMIAYFHEDETEANKKAQGYGGSLSNRRIYTYGSTRVREDKLYGQQLNSLKAFTKAIINKGQQLAEVEEGLGAEELLNGIYLSSWLKKTISLPIDDDEYEKMLTEKIKEEKSR